jgi:hypothetical protein
MLCVLRYSKTAANNRAFTPATTTPADVYYGRAEPVLEQRHAVLRAAYAKHPERFPNGVPTRPVLAPATYINPPQTPAHERPTPDLSLAGAASAEEVVAVLDPARYRATGDLH